MKRLFSYIAAASLLMGCGSSSDPTVVSVEAGNEASSMGQPVEKPAE